MSRFLIYVAYWTLVFGGASWFVHETWPYGLAMIPLAAAQIYGQRLLHERYPDSEAKP